MEIKVGDVTPLTSPPMPQKRLSMPTKAVHRVIGIEGAGGKAVEHWGVEDNLGLMTQLGLVEPPISG